MKWYAISVDLKKHGTILNHARADKFTQAEVAAKLGVAQNVVSKMETHGFSTNSRISEKTVSLYHQFADIVGVPKFDFGVVVLDREAGVRVAPPRPVIFRTSQPHIVTGPNPGVGPTKRPVNVVSVTQRNAVIMALLHAVESGHLSVGTALAAITSQF